MATEGVRVRVTSGGRIAIPEAVLERLGLGEYDELILHHVSDRVLVLGKPEPTPFEQALARIQREAAARGITREDVEVALREAKQEVYAETYGASQDGPPAPGGDHAAT